ncbi:MAG TPA: DUF488 domain-containing protein [Methanosarcinales archaeon]|nr:DUF488 domain-containing protein [Methanosarcinales archaeon]
MTKKTKLYTIGSSKKTVKEFFTLLEKNKITKIVDVRLHNNSQLSGFAKSEILEYIIEILNHCKNWNIKYQYMPQLAPTEELLRKWRNREINWKTYEKCFFNIIKQRNLKAIGFIDKVIREGENVCLLCAEDSPDKCHRRLLAEFFKQVCKKPEIEIIHLKSEDLLPKEFKTANKYKRRFH